MPSEQDNAPSEPAELPRGFVALHRYFIWADRMRVHFNAVIAKDASKPKNDLGDIMEHFLYMSYWYAGMYVVIEGYRELELADPDVDRLLASPNVDLLRRYRNGAFHFQKEYLDARFAEFMAPEANTVEWIRDLREAFSAYFLRVLRSRREQQSS